jgi:hypothetical protein
MGTGFDRSCGFCFRLLSETADYRIRTVTQVLENIGRQIP